MEDSEMEVSPVEKDNYCNGVAEKEDSSSSSSSPVVTMNGDCKTVDKAFDSPMSQSDESSQSTELQTLENGDAAEDAKDSVGSLQTMNEQPAIENGKVCVQSEEENEKDNKVDEKEDNKEDEKEDNKVDEKEENKVENKEEEKQENTKKILEDNKEDILVDNTEDSTEGSLKEAEEQMECNEEAGGELTGPADQEPSQNDVDMQMDDTAESSETPDATFEESQEAVTEAVQETSEAQEDNEAAAEIKADEDSSAKTDVEKVSSKTDDQNEGSDSNEPNAEKAEVRAADSLDKPQISLEPVDSPAAEDDDDDLAMEDNFAQAFEDLEKEVEEEEANSEDQAVAEDKAVGSSEDGNGEFVETKASSSGSDSDSAIVESSKARKTYVDESPMESTVNSDNDQEEAGNEADVEDNNSRLSVDEGPKVDLEQALQELEQIEKNNKSIMEETETKKSTPGKRESTDEAGGPSAKRLRADETEEQAASVKRDIKKKLKRQLRSMKRSDLEELIASKIVEVLTNNSEIGRLRQECDSFKDMVEKWKAKSMALSKQCTDLGTVMRKYISDSKVKSKEELAPVRITRSVGLQVMPPDQRRLQQQRLSAGGPARRTPVPRSLAAAPPPAPTAVAPVSSRPKVNGSTNTRPGGGMPVRPGLSISRQPANRPLVRPTGAQQRPLAPRQPQSVPKVAERQVSVPQAASKPVIDVVDLSDDESTPPQQQLQVSKTLVQAPAKPVVPSPMVSRPQRAVMARQQLVVPGANQLIAFRPNIQMRGSRPFQVVRSPAPRLLHPAPLPAAPHPQPSSPGWKQMPPRPLLKISKAENGIVLSWNMPLNLAVHAIIHTYQLYAYQESGQRPDQALWKKVGDVKALPLPMACTLTQFTKGNKYHFAVRAMDMHGRVGQFSEPASIMLN